MKKEELIEALKGHEKSAVEQYAAYVARLFAEKKKINGQEINELKNPWIQQKKVQEFVELFERVKSQGLVFDGKHITLSSTGISFDYVAYKNKMLLAYPESKMALNVVYEGDPFSFEENDGKVTYSHVHKNPFGKEDKNIIGAYCLIKNSRGEFLTTMGLEEIEKHRKVAKTDYIWKAWFPEMVKKTVIKKACKYHFEDKFAKVEAMDNENYDLEIPVEIDLKAKQEIEALKSIKELNAYYKEKAPTGEALEFLMQKSEALHANN